MHKRILFFLSMVVWGCQSTPIAPFNQETPPNSEPVVDAGTTTDSGFMVDAGVMSDAGPGESGFAVFEGNVTFPIKTVMAFAQAQGDGGIRLSEMGIALISVAHPCQPMQNPVTGPGQGFVMLAESTSGTVQGTTLSNGLNMATALFNPDGGEPLEYEYAAPDAGSFSIQWGSSPSSGVTGSFQARMGDGGIVQGTYSAVLCVY